MGIGMKHFVTLATLALIAIGVIGCDSTATNTAGSPDSSGGEFADFEIKKPAPYGGEFNPAGRTVGLQVGQLAPEIEGADLDGTDFKLSDYRGKVVMLDFWGDW